MAAAGVVRDHPHRTRERGRPAAAVLPEGIGNLLAGNLGLLRTRNRPSDSRWTVAGERWNVGVVDGQVFAVMEGMGFDAAMMGDALDRLKATIG